MKPLTFAAMLLPILAACGRPAPAPMRSVQPCTAASCAALPADHAAAASLWGAKGDGSTDDAAALNAAFAYCGGHAGVTILLTGSARAAGTVTIPGGCAVTAVGATASAPLVNHIVCDLAVSPCVAAGEKDRRAVVLRGLHIGRAPGAIPAGSVGLLVEGANPVLEDVVVGRSDVCERFYTTAGEATQFGYSARVERGFVFACPSYALEFVGWPEAIVHALRVGQVPFPETPDYDMKAVVHITGGPKQCPTGAGPNSIELNQVYALGGNKEDGSQAIYNALWDFSGLNLPCRQAGIFSFVQGHAEEVRHLAVSDSSATTIDGLRFVHSTWVGGMTDPATSWLALDPATQLMRWTLEDDDVYFWNLGPHCALCLKPDQPIEGLVAADLRFYGRGPDNTPQTGPVNVDIAAPAGSWGRIAGLDMLGGGAIAVTGPGAGGIGVSGTYVK